MAMNAFDASIYGGIVCGIGMVFGGIWLLHKGAINLQVASADPALTVELFQDQFKISTRFPAVALFVIGLSFVAMSLYYGKQEREVVAIRVVGVVDDVADAQVIARSQWNITANNGQINDVVRPHLDVLWIVGTAPGHEGIPKAFDMAKIKDTIQIGKLELRKKQDMPEPKGVNIASLPAGVSPAPLSARGNYGIGETP
jgi:hypothetical protein